MSKQAPRPIGPVSGTAISLLRCVRVFDTRPFLHPPPIVSQLTRLLIPSCLLAGIAAVFFCFAPFSGSDTAAESLIFETRISAAAAGTAQLHYVRNGAASPREFSSAEIKAGAAQPARFVLPAGTYRALRIVAPGPPGDARPGAARIVDLAGEELLRLESGRFHPADGGGAEVLFAQPIVLRSSLAAGTGQGIALFVALTLVLVLGLWRFAAPLEKARARARAALCRGWERACARPVATLLATAAFAVVVSCYPVVFCGQSFVSPNNGAACLYAGYPTLPGAPAGPIENPKFADIGAMLWAHLPYSVVEHEAIFRDRELPLRNRMNSCGVPLLGQGQSMIGDPLHWIPLTAGGAAWAWDVKFIVAKILFAFGIGLLVRAAVGRLGVAVVLAASSAFIGFFAYRFNHAAIFSLSYAPWILLAWLEIARAPAWRGAVRWVALLMVVNWMVLNSGTAKEASMLIVALNASGVLALALRRESRPALARKLALASAGLLIFLLLSAPCWLVFLDALRTAWTTYNVPHAYQIQPGLFLGLFDDLFARQTVARENHTNPSANFFVLLGILWALVHLRRLSADRTFLALALAAVPAMALVFGVVPPGFLIRLPFIGNISHIDNTFSCVLLVLLFPLAGFGLRACRERMADAGWRGDWALTLLLLAACGAAFLGYVQSETRSPFTLLREAGPVTLSPFFRGYALALILAVALLPLIARRLLHARAFTLTNVLLAALAVFALHFRHGMYGPTKFDAYVMNPRERVNLQAPSPVLAHVKAHSVEPARVAGFGDVLTPGFNGVLGLECIGGPDALVNARYREFVDAAKLPVIWDWRLIQRKDTTPVLLPFYELLNVRYFLGMPGDAPAAVAGLKRIGTRDLDLYENPGAWPRAFFTDTLAHYGTADDFAQMVWKGDRRPFAAMQENSAGPTGLPSEAASRQIVAAGGYRLTANTTTFTVDAPASGVAVLTETFEEGNIRVTVDGAPAVCFRVNHAFCGVAIPQAGKFTVRFEYWPRHLTLALWLSAAGLALLGAGAAWLRLSRPSPTA